MDTLRAEWDSAVAQYRAAKASLDSAESQLYAWHDYAQNDPVDAEEWQSNFNRLNAIKSTVDSLESIVASISGAWGWTRETFGLSGRKGALKTLGAVGAAPIVIAGMSVTAFLVLVGKIAAVAAAIYAFVAYLQTKQQLDAQGFYGTTYQALVDEGIDPARASELARKAVTDTASTSAGYTLATEVRKMVMWAALGISAAFVLPKLLESRRR